MMYSKRVNEIQDWLEVQAKQYNKDGHLPMYQDAIKRSNAALAELPPEDFHLAEGDVFVTLGRAHELFKIEDGKLKQHIENDFWHANGAYTLYNAANLTFIKGKWMRLREVPLERG